MIKVRLGRQVGLFLTLHRNETGADWIGQHAVYEALMELHHRVGWGEGGGALYRIGAWGPADVSLSFSTLYTKFCLVQCVDQEKGTSQHVRFEIEILIFEIHVLTVMYNLEVCHREPFYTYAVC